MGISEIMEYPKIRTIFKRDEKTHKVIEDEYSLPEFEYLKDNQWEFTEKIDGTNIRVNWDCEELTFGGRTSNASIPTFLLTRLQELFTVEKMKSVYPDVSIVFFGEGYGTKIQKGGGNYISNGVDFILFDIIIDGWWLKRENIVGIGERLGVKVVPLIDYGTLGDAIKLIKSGVTSVFGSFQAEGLVLKPPVELHNRAGKRIITKIKHKDF